MRFKLIFIFLGCRDNPKLPSMVSKNPDELCNSFWGPQVKRLVGISKALLKYKGKPRKPFTPAQNNLLHVTNQHEPIGHDSKDFHYGQIKAENQTLWLMIVTCSITITVVFKMERNSLDTPPFCCAYKKKKKKSLRNFPINNFLWHSEKFLLCCIRHN